jgi:ribosomal protein S18 acetylase RimI-like enzyme
MNLVIRPIIEADIEYLKDVLDSIELFPSEILEDMISDYFTNPDNEEIWFTGIDHDIPISLGYCAPEKLTDGTFKLYAIGVKNNLQGKGIGKLMMTFIAEELRLSGHRILIVETSSTHDFELTRKFYENLSYSKEAVIRDFWKDGDEKVIYLKKLQ